MKAEDHSAMLGETPLIDDLRSLADEIGGRPTGSEANLASVGSARRVAPVSALSYRFQVPESTFLDIKKHTK